VLLGGGSGGGVEVRIGEVTERSGGWWVWKSWGGSGSGWKGRVSNGDGGMSKEWG
jgi:hypothetical protein